MFGIDCFAIANGQRTSRLVFRWEQARQAFLGNSQRLLEPHPKMLSLKSLFGNRRNVRENDYGIGGEATGQIPGKGLS
jgi:hypothetical protein